VRLLSSLFLMLGLAIAADGAQRSDSRAARVGAMRAIADSVVVAATSSGAIVRFERLAEPVYRFDDPARQFSDGTVWLWSSSGRPVSLLTLSKDRSPDAGLRWIAELTSLASGPISATVEGIGTWQPSSAGVVVRKFPNAPLPDEDATKRLRQMKDLVRLIKAYEFFKPANQPATERYELRALPQPVHRYADASTGVIDGGMFIISYGLNPEIVLLVEAHRDGASRPAWYFGCARIAIAEAHVDFEGKEIWSHAGGYSKGPHDPYWIFTKPIDGE
jgi:hypothetical protein